MALHKQRIFSFIVVSLLSAQLASCSGGKQEEKKATEASKEHGVPVISAVEPKFDFGQVKQGQEVSHIYKIKNIGSKELVIEKTHGS